MKGSFLYQEILLDFATHVCSTPQEGLFDVVNTQGLILVASVTTNGVLSSIKDE